MLDFVFNLIALIVAITIHEFSHAWAAEHLGDPTPRLQGRLTLNPLAHLDPIGTILLILVRFGWGKPVQFDPFNLRHPRRDSAIISIAGPVSNILLATIVSLILRLPMPMIIAAFSVQLLYMNIVLAIFNLVPVHPLDGFKIVEGFLPEEQAREWHQLERYGMIFLIFLLFPIFGGTAPIVRIISPVINFFLHIFLPAT
jgi:Zn-dependent protease